MLNRFIATFLLTSIPALSGLGQTGVAVNFNVAGVIRDKDESVVPGLRLQFTKDGRKTESWTDINGEFKVTLHYGDYELMAEAIPTSKFKVFLKLSQNGPNPEFLDLVLDSAQIDSNSSKYPRIVTSILPRYPPAANAVRAQGNVVISVKINGEGKIVSEPVISGHPLLKATSLQTVRNWTFEISEVREREATIAFVYLLSNEEKPGIARFSNPYRPVITPLRSTIH